MYSNRNSGFQDSGYDITIEWQTLIVTGQASTSGSYAGTSTYYVNGAAVGTTARVGSGTETKFIGYDGQPPGYVTVAGVLNTKLSSDAIKGLHAALASGVVGSSSCTACAAGRYSYSGASACTDCTAGKYSAASGTTSCTSCAAGQWQLSSGQSQCESSSSPTPSPSMAPTMAQVTRVSQASVVTPLVRTELLVAEEIVLKGVSLAASSRRLLGGQDNSTQPTFTELVALVRQQQEEISTLQAALSDVLSRLRSDSV